MRVRAEMSLHVLAYSLERVILDALTIRRGRMAGVREDHPIPRN